MNITKDMTFGEVIQKYPKTAEVMLKYGLHCIGCAVSNYESIEQGATAHGLDEEDLEKMLKELNKVTEEKQ